jgi:hypothetical protein
VVLTGKEFVGVRFGTGDVPRRCRRGQSSHRCGRGRGSPRRRTRQRARDSAASRRGRTGHPCKNLSHCRSASAAN